MNVTTVESVAAARAVPTEVLQGYDTFAGSARASALVGKANQAGGRQRCDYTMCETTESLYKALSVSSDVAANFGVGSVEAKAEYVHSLETTSTSVVIAIYANKVLGTTSYTSAQLKDGVKPPTKDDLNEFYQSYGDSFLSGITMGAEYIATYVFYSQSVEEQTHVKASLEAKGITQGGQVTAKVQTAVDEVRKTSTVRSTFKQQIYGFSNLPFPTPEQLVEFALAFSGKDPNSPTVIDFETDGYEHAPGMSPTVWTPIRTNRERFTAPASRRGVNAAAEGIDALVNQIKWLRAVYSTYGYTGDSELAARQQQVEQDYDELAGVVDGIKADPTQPFEVPKLESLSWGLPVLTFAGPDLPAKWGRDGGQEFKDVNRQAVLNQRVLKVVALRGARLVDQLACTYGSGQPLVHGGGGGDPAPPLDLGRREYVVVLRGSSGAVVDALEVESSTGQKTRTGGTGGTPFKWTVPPGSVVVGFAGRSARLLDQVGPLVCTFRPATWEKP
jgi:hypothetical protein